MAVCEHLFERHDELAAALAARIAGRLQAAVDCDGRATLFVSGGSTPAAAFDALSRARIDWRAVTVGLVDERWVAEDHEASNTALVKRHLLTNRAAAASWWPMYRGGAIEQEVEALRADLPLAAGRGPTVAHIGIGADLHTASIFPGAAETPRALSDRAPPVMHTFPTGTPANPPYARATLTRPVLARAGLLVLLLRGEDKLARYRDALDVPAGRAGEAPVAALLADPAVTVEVYWSP